MPRVAAIELVEDRTRRSRCDEGFLHVRRYTARNRRADGSCSREYPIDVIERPTLDAVAVCLWARSPAGPAVLLRRQLRPAAYFRRDQSPALPETPYLLFEEVVAGVVEPGEKGFEALQRRAAAEVAEEAGLELPPERFLRLGGPVFMLPGTASEKIHLVQAEVSHDGREGPWPAPGDGDGSPLEEGAELLWRPLGAALEAFDEGELEDAKTEIALRRLAALLSGPGPGPVVASPPKAKGDRP